jgi:alpha-galactosidase
VLSQGGRDPGGAAFVFTAVPVREDNMKVRRSVPLLSLMVAALPSCSSGDNRAAASDGGGVPEAASSIDGSSTDSGGGEAGALGPDDIDDDLPLPLAAGIAPTPPMGWNSWNSFSSSVSETLIDQIADIFVSSGMKAAGYQYVNIDDGWGRSIAAPDGIPQATRAADGTALTDPNNFPNGIKPVADYVHNAGLKLGIYSDRGTATCGSRVASGGYETQDATSYAAWGVDYLKYDNCNASTDLVIQQTQYQTMGSALGVTGRPFVYSLCAWSFYEWGVDLGSMWRTTTDIQAIWTSPTGGSVFGNVMGNRSYAAYAGPNKYMAAPPQGAAGAASTADGVPYGWNDPDMLEVGRQGLSDVENQSHFSLWAISASPLIAGNDLRIMSATTKSILTNQEVIAIDQDALGLQGVPVQLSSDQLQSVWAKPLNQSGARAVVLVNAGESTASLSFKLSDIGLRGGSATARDLVAQKDLGAFTDSYPAVNLAPHASVTLKVMGVEPPRPYGTAFLSDLAWTYAANGLGFVHRDESNSSSAPVTGTPIKLRGTAYTKGLGVDGPSYVVYRLAQKCTSFTATVGVDDAAGGYGSVVFQVWADGQKLFDSGVMTGMSPAQPVQVALDGMRRLNLLVTNAGDGNGQDRADWADAKVVCAP